ncbi:MAG: TRAP transporter large permease, partial [Halocynthiibacter sp.]
MEPITIGLIVSGIMLLMVVLGMRVAFAAGLAGMIGLIWIFWAKKNYGIDDFGWALTVATKTAGQVPHSKVTTQALSLIPTFILIGYLAYYAGLTQALFEAAKRWIAWVPGGLAVSTVFATAGFAAVSGASVATAAVFARIAIPEMLKIGYDKRFAAGVVAAGGTLASLIPPSAILVIYAIIVEQDVGKLLLAGFLPGIFSAIVYGLLIIGMAMVIKDFGPPVKGFTWRERFECLPAALPILFVVATIILFVYNPFGGDAWGTPTEGGAIGAFVVFCIALWRGMRWPQLKDALLETAKLSVMIFTIIWGVLIYVRFLGFADLPGAFSDWITGLEQSPMLTLVFILLAYAVLGMFMDAIGMLLLTLPVVYPAVMALNGGEFVSAADSTFGMSGPMCAIWFGILVVKMAEFCLITPPIGLNCFVVAGVRDDLSVQDVFKGVTPFFIADAITIALLVA